MFSTASLPVLSALSASILWGLFPLYWRLLKTISPTEVLAHRVVWSLLFLAGILVGKRQLTKVSAKLTIPVVGFTILSSLFIAVNWGLYLYAVTSQRVLDASLGYFINPLLNAAIGVLWFGEKATARTVVAVSLCTSGLFCMTFEVGGVPILSLLIAGSFVLYSVARKKSPLDSIEGLFVETVLLTPIAATFLTYLAATHTLQFAYATTKVKVLLSLSGVVTSLPLLLFAFGARGISLTTLGLCQYIAPTIQFLIGWLLFNEPLHLWKSIGFCLIWAAVTLYAVGAYRAARRAQASA